MVVMEAEANRDLLARCKAQDALISQLMKEGIEDVLLSPLEKEDLKQENDALKLRMFDLQEEHLLLTKQLWLDISKVKAEKTSLVSENAVLKIENDDLKKQVTSLEREVIDMKREVAHLEREVANQNRIIVDLKRDIADLKEKMSKLTGFEKIMIKKLLDECRRKCREVLVEANMKIPVDWNMVCQDPAMVLVLNMKGLSVGLRALIYGVNTLQYQGLRVAHDIIEDPHMYATIVCKMTGVLRDRLLNVFEFIFGVSAETVEFKDELDGL